MRLLGDDVTGLGVRERRERGLAYVPEDRPGIGTAGTLSVSDNLAVGHHRRPPLSGGRMFSRRAARSQAG